MKRHGIGLFLTLAALSAPSMAQAHLVNSGVGPFYDGALHLILSPMDIVRLLALCLFAGAQGPASARSIVLSAPVAWFLAGLAALVFGATATFDIANAVTLLLIGAAIAADLKLPQKIATALAAAYAGFLGFQAGVALQPDNADWVALLGTTAVAGAIVLAATALIASATAFPLRVGCRVLGSWAAAVGLLSIGWIIAMAK